MKPLKPSIRERKRYLLLQGRNLKINVPRSITEFIGSLGIAKTSPKFIKVNESKAILSINRKSLEHVRASFALHPNEIKVLKVSGTLKGLKSK